MENNTTQRTILLKNGNELSFEMTEKLEMLIRKEYKISESDEISDDSIRNFLASAVSDAVLNAERDEDSITSIQPGAILSPSFD
jgi:hypothetical protein